MAKYFLTGINDQQWKRFKAACNLQGITIKQSFLSHIDHEVADFQRNPQYTQGFPSKEKQGGKKK